MAVLTNYPTIRPSLDMNFAGSKIVDPRITFTRASSATYFDSTGVLRTAAANEPRIDHDPETGECLGLLVEQQKTNLLLWSEDVGGAGWIVDRHTVTANAATAPDGSMSAALIVPTTALGLHYVRQALLGVSTSAVYTWSGFVKQGPGEYTHILTFSANIANGELNYPTRGNIRFNLSTGNASTETFGNASIVSTSMKSVGGGWYRCVASFIPDTTGVSTALGVGEVSVPVGQTPSLGWVPDGTSGHYVWGVQLEAGSSPTSYIKTEASQVTRSTEIVAMTGVNFSSWYRQDEGTFLVEAIADNYAVAGVQVRRFIQVDSAEDPGNNRVQFGRGALVGGGSDALRFQNNQDVLTPSSAIYFGDIVPGETNKVAVAYSSSRVPSIVYDGVLRHPIESGYTGMTAGKNRLVIGGDHLGTGVGALNGYIRQIRYYPHRLTDEQLSAITT